MVHMLKNGPGYDADDLRDVPGTTIFSIASARKAYFLHRFCMSLMKAENRQAFKLDENTYLCAFPMREDQRDAVLVRDYNRLIALGGNFYFLVKLASTDGWSVQRAVGTMTGMTADEYGAMMIAGGRSPEGARSIRKGN